jgi:branched-chain amino acid transport system permease protein
VTSKYRHGLALVVLLALLCLPLSGSRYLIDLTTEVAIYALFALSLNLLVGYAGDISFGHAAYFAIGAYACAILLTTYQWPLIFSLPAAVLLSGTAALLIGFFCVRLSAIYFAMLTLAFAMLVWSVAFKWRALTGGDDGFIGVRLPPFLEDRIAFFYFTLTLVIGCSMLLRRICRSAFGHTLLALRENRTRAEFIGIDTRRVRLFAFVLAGAFAGVAGALFAMYNRGVYVESAFWTESARVLIMVLLGGIYSFFGPVLGAAVLYLLEAIINQYTEYWPGVLGLILLAILLFFPDGLIGLGRRWTSAKAP